MPGRVTSVVEVTHVSRHGFWLLLGDDELLVRFARFSVVSRRNHCADRVGGVADPGPPVLARVER